MKFFLSAADRARIAAAARAAFPRECCGLIEGIWEADSASALRLHPAANLAEAADRFEIAPEDHFAALKAARNAGRELIGCYHSHPDGKAAPSARDLAEAGEERFVWLIAGLGAGEDSVTLAAFCYSAGRFMALGMGEGADLVTSSLKTEK